MPRSAEVRIYDRLFTRENPEEGETGFLGCLNPTSLSIAPGWVEPGLTRPAVGEHFQFERLGYFAVDQESNPGRPVFNLTVNLRDTWAKLEKKTA